MIKSGDGDANKELVMENRFPVTVCTTEIPGNESELEGRTVKINGVFFKLWNYDSELTARAAHSPQQISPLIISTKPTVTLIDSPVSQWIAIASGGLIALIILLFWLCGFFSGPPQNRSSSSPLPEKISIPNDPLE